MVLSFLILVLNQASDDINARYSQAESLGKRAQSAFVGGSVDIEWLESEKLRYSRQQTKQTKETVEIDLKTGATSPAKDTPKKTADFGRGRRTGRPTNARGEGFSRPNVVSSDGTKSAFIRDHNAWIKVGKEERPLSKDGTSSDGYQGRFFWSPTGKYLIAIRHKNGHSRKVNLVESSPRDQLQPRTKTIDYLKPGDAIPQDKPRLFDTDTGKEIPISDALFPNPWSISHERWDPDGKRFTFLYNQRGHTVMRLIALDPATGTASVLMEEPIKTFFDYAHKQFFSWLPDGDFLWMSERDGWNHVFRMDGQSGKQKSCLTPGNWIVTGVDRVDASKGLMWIRGSGIDPKQDPYHVHHGLVRLNGDGVTWLTSADGTHSARFSPDNKYLVATWSRVDHPPVVELRNAMTGALIKELDRGTRAELDAERIPLPERFVSKGRDGTTDIWGIIIKPSHFDPKKKYPVIENIYAGPQGFFVPKAFRAWFGTMNELAELGFIVVQIDGMGTSGRSKAFHDVCWKNLGDSGLADRIAWMKSAAQSRPWMDLSRVGIYGGSAGGQSSTRAVLAHPEFYKVAVSDCGCHDNRMDKIWWNELWMSWPIGPHYAEQSNVTQAHRLKGKLLLVVGEMDTNVDPASTMQVAHALVKANKDFDLLVIPGAGHGACESPYGRRKRKDFFVRHLLGLNPPNWN